MKNNVEIRLKDLETRLLPPEPWEITAQFSDGHIEILTAEDYARHKLAAPSSVFVADRRVTGNLREFQSWLSMVEALAAMLPDEDMQL